MSEERRPSDTHPIDRRQLLEQMRDVGAAETCPACAGDGIVSPRVAARVRLALPVSPSDRPTLPDATEPEDTES